MLLEILSAWQFPIPEFGTVEAKSIPFVVLISNEKRRLGDPIRLRSLYVRVEHPTPARKVEIIASRTPDADEKFHRAMAGIALSFRNYSLEKPPTVSEMINFVNAQSFRQLPNDAAAPIRDWFGESLSAPYKWWQDVALFATSLANYFMRMAYRFW
jgi:MoxR-like ATPase